MRRPWKAPVTVCASSIRGWTACSLPPERMKSSTKGIEPREVIMEERKVMIQDLRLESGKRSVRQEKKMEDIVNEHREEAKNACKSLAMDFLVQKSEGHVEDRKDEDKEWCPRRKTDTKWTDCVWDELSMDLGRHSSRGQADKAGSDQDQFIPHSNNTHFLSQRHNNFNQ